MESQVHSKIRFSRHDKEGSIAYFLV